MTDRIYDEIVNIVDGRDSLAINLQCLINIMWSHSELFSYAIVLDRLSSLYLLGLISNDLRKYLQKAAFPINWGQA